MKDQLTYLWLPALPFSCLDRLKNMVCANFLPLPYALKKQIPCTCDLLYRVDPRVYSGAGSKQH